MHYGFKKNQGFAVLLFVMVMSSIVLFMSISVSLRSIEGLQKAVWQQKAQSAYMAAYACAHDGLLQLKKNWADYNYSFTINGNLCTIQISTTNIEALLDVRGTVGNYNRNIQIIVSRNLSILQWDE